MLEVGAGQADVAQQVIVHLAKTVTLTGTILPVEQGVGYPYDQGPETLEADVEDGAGRPAVRTPDSARDF